MRHMVPHVAQLQSEVRPGRSTTPTSPVRPHVGQIDRGSACGSGWTEAIVVEPEMRILGVRTSDDRGRVEAKLASSRRSCSTDVPASLARARSAAAEANRSESVMARGSYRAFGTTWSSLTGEVWQDHGHEDARRVTVPAT
jgi:hypothetical protein